MVFVDKWTYQEVAVRLRVSRGLVTRIVKAYKADPTVVERMIEKELSLQQKIVSVQESVEELLSRDRGIRKISVVQKHIQQSSDMDLKPWFIAKCMRRVANLKYSKIRRVPFRANIECCLVLRYLYAK